MFRSDATSLNRKKYIYFVFPSSLRGNPVTDTAGNIRFIFITVFPRVRFDFFSPLIYERANYHDTRTALFVVGGVEMRAFFVRGHEEKPTRVYALFGTIYIYV